ncbi:MAG: hypothetical protein M3Y40_00290 [Chloroflexota bacterium]|nr:hypothetical protein [Chloroflexota bacterium]
MELAALSSFAILVVAWIIAPDRPRSTTAIEAAVPEPEPEAQPIAA